MNLCAYNLTERHMNRTITADGLTGTLVGTIPCAGDVTLVLMIGGSRAYKSVPMDAPVVVEKAAAK